MCDIRNTGQAAARAFTKAVPSNRDNSKLRTSGSKEGDISLPRKTLPECLEGSPDTSKVCVSVINTQTRCLI